MVNFPQIMRTRESMKDLNAKIETDRQYYVNALERLDRLQSLKSQNELIPIVDLLTEVSEIYTVAGHPTISLSGTKSDLVRVMRALYRRGYRTSTKPKKDDPSYYGFFRNEYARIPEISVLFSSTVCQQVQIGTETIERPVYKTVCA